MARKTNDFTDFIEFLKSHPDYTRTKAIEKFRESGGHIQKKRGLEIARQVMGDIEKGQARNQKVIVKNEKIKTKPALHTSNRFVKINGKVTQDRASPAIELLQKHINKLMGTTNHDKFLKVGMTVKGDLLTEKKNAYFGIMIPIDKEKKRLGAKTFAKDLFKNLNTYYSNLAKRYRANHEKNEMVNQVISNLENLKSELSNINSSESLTDTYKKYGFDITDISYFIIDDFD